MSCAHFQTMDPRRDRLHSDFKYPHNCYITACNTSTVRSPCSEVCSNRNYTSWKSPDFNTIDNEAYREDRGDPPFSDSSIQMGRISSAHKYESTRHGESASTITIERMQIRLKFLEDSNATLHLRNRELDVENRNLAKRLQEDMIKMEKLQENVTLLQNELNNERVKLADTLAKQTKNVEVCLEDKCTSSTNIICKTDHGSQIWETCKGCQEELEGCQRKPTVTITKSEFELLEGDMRVLRDAVVAREEAWDKAMERERNCRQQLARLTSETITSRHLCETRQDELRAVTETLTEKESELKMMQKEVQYLDKLIAKLYRHQKELEGKVSGDVNFNISEKDQRCIEEIVRRVRSSKGKSKMKSKHPHSNSSSPRESKNGKDHAGSLEDRRN